MYRSIFQKSVDGMLIIENDIFIDCNTAIINMIGYTNKNQLLNTNPSELSPKYQPNGELSFNTINEKTQVAFEKGSNKFEWQYKRANGELFWVEVVLTDISTENKKLLLTVWREISDRKELEKRQLDEYQTIFNYAKSGLAIMDMESNFLDFNEAHRAITEFSREELLLRSCVDMSIPEDIPRSIAIVQKVIKEGFVASYTKSCITKSKKIVAVEMSLVLMPDKKRILISVRDVTLDNEYKLKLEEYAQDQKELASIDELTSIYNRRSFFDISQKLLQLSSRTKNPISLMMLDIDYFKKVNDTYGHISGDQVLKYVANNIQCKLRESDLFARYGGEEFIILLPNTNLTSALETAEKIRSLFLENIYSKNNTSIPITISIGVAEHKEERLIRELIHKADLALYTAKENGRNRVESLS